jgi:hypothetical protein
MLCPGRFDYGKEPLAAVGHQLQGVDATRRAPSEATAPSTLRNLSSKGNQAADVRLVPHPIESALIRIFLRPGTVQCLPNEA